MVLFFCFFTVCNGIYISYRGHNIEIGKEDLKNWINQLNEEFDRLRTDLKNLKAELGDQFLKGLEETEAHKDIKTLENSIQKCILEFE